TGQARWQALRDGGVVAAVKVFLRVADRPQRSAQRVDDLVVGVPGDLEGEVGLLRFRVRVHPGIMELVWIAVKGYYYYQNEKIKNEKILKPQMNADKRPGRAPAEQP